MPNVNTPFGLKPLRYKSGAPYNGAAVPMYIDAAYATALFIGDPVVKVVAGSNAAPITVPGGGSFNIGTLPQVEKAAAADAARITGVIVGFAAAPTDLENQYNPANTERVVFVANDPFLVFEIQADGAVPATSIGMNANLIYTNAGSMASGISGAELDTSLIAADASNQLLILQAVNRVDVDTTLIWSKLEVLINQHTENQGTVGSLGI